MADPQTYLADVVSLLRQEWPANRTVNIVCHGHSVPAGYFRTPRVDTFHAYPHLLHREIKDHFPVAVVNVLVTAIGGEHSERGAARFARDVLAIRPDVITLDYALNDRGLGLVRARAAWVAMISEALAAQAKVVLLTPTADLAANLDDPGDPLNQHAEQVRTLAREFDLALADSLAAFRRHMASGGQLRDLMSQGNHPNRAGHDLVVRELSPWFLAPVSH